MKRWQQGLSVLLLLVLGLAGMVPALTAAGVSPARPNPDCALLDDPGARARMSAALELALLEACGHPVSEQGLSMGQPVSGGVQSAPDVRVTMSDPVSATSFTQSETSIAVDANTGTLCSHWNDSYHYHVQGLGYIGFANSTDGGQTWNDTPTNYLPQGSGGRARGDPSVVWRRSDGYFYATSIHENTGSGDYGLGFWRSVDDCATFQWRGMAHAGSIDDKELMAVDNYPSSPHYGRLYIAWTDFWAGGMTLIYSDNGTTWSTPVLLSDDDVQGAWPAVAPNGDVYVAWLRWNLSGLMDMQVARSTNGGASFTQVTNAASNLTVPRDAAASQQCGRDALNGYIRYLPSPQIAVGPDGCLHVVYSYDPDGQDVGDVVNSYYRRSCNQGTTWEAEHRLNDDATLTDQFFPNVAVNENNVVAASWYDRRLDPAGNLLFDRYWVYSTDGGSTWGANERISDVSSPVYTNPASCYHGDYDQLTADASAVYMPWSDDRRFVNGHYDPDIWFEAPRLACDPVTGADFTWEPLAPAVGQTVEFSATAWSGDRQWITETVDPGGDGYVSLVLDSLSRPRMSYIGAGGLTYAYDDGGGWITQTVDSSVGYEWGGSTSLALDAAGRPHISYNDDVNTRLMYAYFDGTAWQLTAVNAANDGGYWSSLALDAAGRPYISYQTWSGYLEYAWYDGTLWQHVRVDPQANSGYFTSLALDDAGHPHIVYCASPYFSLLSYAWFDGSTWHLEAAAVMMGSSNSLALDSAGHPHISSWLYDPANGDHAHMAYVWSDGSDWYTATLETAPSWGGGYTSIAVDALDRPHIGYSLLLCDPGCHSTALRYARRVDTGWQIEILAGVGSHVSMKLDPAGWPRIGYVAPTGLAYAWLPSAPASPPVSYDWDLGDGTMASGPVVGHSYALPGLYTVTLTATNCATGTATAVHTVTVTPCEPVIGVDFAWSPLSPVINQQVAFTSTIPGNPPPSLPITYTWDLGDGTLGDGASVIHTYALPGLYTVTLTATNCGGATAVATHTLTVLPPPCAPVQDVLFSWLPPTPTLGQVVAFGGTATGTQPITYNWSFGDGALGSGASVTHTYASSGIFHVVLTATNCATATAVATHTLTVLPVPCAPVQDVLFSWLPPTPTLGQVVAFSGTATGTQPITYSWSFGDSALGSGASVTHTYALPGLYTVTLTATNCGGATAVATHTLTVLPPPCAPVQDVLFSWLPPTPTLGQVVTFSGTAAGTQPITYSWSFGDGALGSGASVTHTYASSGTFPVVLTATNCATATAMVVQTLTVAPLPCAAVEILSVTQSISGCQVMLEAELSGTAPFEYRWAFGDGMTSTAPMPVHSYSQTGSYNGTLSVWNCGSDVPAVRGFAVTVACPARRWTVYLPLVFKAAGP